MDHLTKLQTQLQMRFWLPIVLLVLLTGGVVWYVVKQDLTSETYVLLGVGATAVALTILIANYLAQLSLKPLKTLQQAITHVYPEGEGAPAPELDKLHLGRQLITVLATQVYQLAAQETSKDLVASRQRTSQSANIISHMPLPLFAFNKSQQVTFSSDAALDYIKLNSAKVYGKPLFDNLKLEFASQPTLEDWINDCQDKKVVDVHHWEHIRVHLPDKTIRQADMNAYYNRDNPSGIEFIVTLFDRTDTYNVQDDGVDFVAMAVHELRTPLTLMRGYIEVFEEELESSKIDAEMQSYMHKLTVSASQLSALINNILSVARIDNNQFSVHLAEEDWQDILRQIVEETQLKANVNGINIRLEFERQIPSVAVDRVSIYEVMSNLLDNAIKYSNSGDEIIVRSRVGKNNLIETTVEDHGVGIPENVMGHLFEKFSRSYKTSKRVGGSGLGLYLCRTIVNAHGGQIWVQSKEGQGSTFGFTILPYYQASEQINRDNREITRHAHGWIKNHSLYRR